MSSSKDFFMKNITLLLLLITTFISCSKSETEAEIELETTIPQELIGSWQFKGIYTHDVHDENDMPIFTAYQNGAITSYRDDKTFTHQLGEINYSGDYKIISNNIIKLSYIEPSTNSLISGSNKITMLTNSVLETSCVNETSCDTYRYEKVPSN